jgi:hypothetical protein
MATPNLHLQRFPVDYIHRRQHEPSLHIWSAMLEFDEYDEVLTFKRQPA